MEKAKKKDTVTRPARFMSHTLAEVKRFKHLPFFCHSAVLLDISLGGFKLEFTGEVSATVGQQYWLNIPLSPLGIYAPSRLLCKVEVRWFDDKNHRIGGVFMEASKKDQLIIEQIIDSLRKRGSLK